MKCSSYVLLQLYVCTECPKIQGLPGTCNIPLQKDIEKSFTVLGFEASLSQY